MHLVGLNQFMGSQPFLLDKSNGNIYLNEQKTCTDSLKEIAYYYKNEGQHKVRQYNSRVNE
jgi:hypothetical protein